MDSKYAYPATHPQDFVVASPVMALPFPALQILRLDLPLFTTHELDPEVLLREDLLFSRVKECPVHRLLRGSTARLALLRSPPIVRFHDPDSGSARRMPF